MSSIIKIKRSSVTGNPTTLAAGELAYSALPDNGSNGGDRLYIGIGVETAGNAASHLVIGGKYFTDLLDHTPGVLTTSSALIVDANKKIDDFYVDNLQLNGNTLQSTNSNGNLILNANGSGKISFYNAYSFPRTDGTPGYGLVTDGAGNLSWAAVSASTATNLAGGTAGQVPYQTAAGITAFYGPGTAGQLLVSAGAAAPVYTNTASIYVGRAVLADTVTKWTNARTVTFATGNVTGSFSIDGSADVNNVVLTFNTSTLVATAVSAQTATTATNAGTAYATIGTHTAGSGLSGTTFNGASNVTWTLNTATLMQTSVNLAGGSAGQIAYQSAANTTAFIGTGSIYVGRAVLADTVTKWTNARTVTFATGNVTGSFSIDGSADVNNVALTFNTGTVVAQSISAQSASNLAGGTTGAIAYQTTSGVTTFLNIGSAGQVLQVSTTTGLAVWGDIDGGTY